MKQTPGFISFSVDWLWKYGMYRNWENLRILVSGGLVKERKKS
jgi:hypothetical protein